ncbi:MULTISPECIES: YceI family protein [unclassified Acinetobacter]|uniref:YceI family protein n=1 Tax=unclassified Acinetobacter TaxID=196816 RepID=UPI00190DD4FB|nr:MULTISPECIES: YceI family protein [unclassified Acinetobacter]MBK0063120.1 polyisoprenoid-binding protein [Acinetobacter sp. S55]MBK0066462.1 polyisoprenoid-binding protein [Acinetobacter sp. S54]
MKNKIMHFGKLSALVVLSILTAHTQAANWSLNGKPNIGFYIQHLGLKTIDATFNQVNSNFQFNPDELQQSKATFVMDAKSLSLTQPALKNTVLGPDFFNIEKYPEATFKSTHFQANGHSKYAIEGNLTLRGMTRPVVFVAIIQPTQNPEVMNISASTEIRRSDFGMKPALGGMGEIVHIHMNGTLKIASL